MKEAVVKCREISRDKVSKKVRAFLAKTTLEETAKGLIEAMLKTMETEGKD